ncbi:MAG TPA: FkbM family methyltransferase [Lacibacter sp.]|nr:FkbM family methyltransferase [Lacibacter sp.]
MIEILKKIILKAKIEFRFLQKRFDQTIVRSESINKNYIRQFLPANPVIIDAGAHVGGDSIEMCRLYKGSTIHAFEPVPAIFRLLKHNTRKFKQIHCHTIALSNQNGTQTMHVSSGASDGSSSLLKPKDHLNDHPDVFFNEAIPVVTQTLDAWAAAQGINRVDLLWLDMQGFELEVLKASNKILPAVTAVHMEVSTRSTYEGVPLYDEVKAWMESKGFRVEVEAIPQGWDMGNVLFVRHQ